MTLNRAKKGVQVRINSGRFVGKVGVVLKVHQNKNGVSRVQIKAPQGIFEYMPESLKEHYGNNKPASTVVAKQQSNN